MWRLWILHLLLCALTAAAAAASAAASAEVLGSKEARGSSESSLKFAESQSSQLNVECHVGSVCTIHNAGLAKLDKSLIPSWIVRKMGSNDTFHGVPTDMDAGTHIVPELGLVVQVTYSLRGLAASCLLHRTSPTVAVVSLDTDLGRLPGDSRIDLFSRLAKVLHSGEADKALASVFYLSRARNQPENLKNLFLLATGPGNTNTMRTNGSLLAWRVGCGSVAPTQLSSLQRLEKTAVTGELSKRLGFPVRQWFVADDRRLIVEARRLRRHRTRRSPTVNQWGPGGVAGPENYLSPEGSGNSYYDNEVGSSGLGPIFELPPQPVPGRNWGKPPPPRNDRLPISRLQLPKYIVKVGEARQIFTIEEGTFYDPEDGTNLRMELTYNRRNVNELRNFWLHFSSEERRIVVKDVSGVSKGNHSFLLCAYDRMDNQICQKLTIQVGSNLLATITINIFAGEYFERPLTFQEWKAIEHNVDDDKRMLIFAVSEINRKGEIMNNTNSWVGFDTGGYQFYCFPSLKLVDHTKEFRLFVRRRDGRRSGFFKVFFKIGLRRQNGLTHTIAMNISNPSYSASKFLNDPWLKVEFLKALAGAFGEPRHLNFFLIQKFDSPFKTVTPYLQLGYSRRRRRQAPYNDRKLVTVEWAHRQAFSRDGKCNVNTLQIIMNRLFEVRNGRVVWRQQIQNNLRPFVLHDFRVEARGVCENEADKFIPRPTSTWLNSSGKQKIDPLPLPPAPKKPKPLIVTADDFVVYAGLMFKSTLRSKNGQQMDLIRKNLRFSRAYPPPSWVAIEDDKLYGLPMLNDLGQRTFKLNVIEDLEVVMIVTVNFRVAKDPSSQNLNHRVTMNILPIDGNFENSKTLRSRLQLVEKLETYLEPNCNMGYGKSCGQGIALLDISEKKDVTLSNKDWARILEVDWAWRPYYKMKVPHCPRNDIENNLIPRLYREGSGNKKTILLESTLKDIGFKPEAISVGFSGPCVKGRYSGGAPEPSISPLDENHSMPVWKILLIAGMVIGVLLAALGATVFFCLKTQRRDKGGPEPEPAAKPPAAAAPPARAAAAKPPAPMPQKQAQPLRQPQAAKPTFEEMEDAAAAPTKPLILPHEKPPVPPPDFGVIDLSARPAPSAPSRSQQPTLQRRPLNPYRNMPPNFTR